MRLDHAVAARFPEFSRRQARELITDRRVLVNERVVAIASREIDETDRIRVVADEFPLEVIAATDDWVAVNKPPGLPTQPARDRAKTSLEELMRVRYREIYLVHRIDTPASGIVIFARNRRAAADLSKLFSTGAIRKRYLAVAGGPPLQGEVMIDAPIFERSAITMVRPLHGALVEAEIRTGRTHQIRIHLSSIGRPIVGDKRYGGAPAPRLMLHAWKLEHPSIGSLEASMPKEFATADACSAAG